MSFPKTATKEVRSKSSVTRQRVEDDLRRRVRLGHWRAGTMLPGRRALAKEYRADLHTLQQAVEQLVADGLLRVDGGRGTFVADSHTEIAAPFKSVAAILNLSFNPAQPSSMAIPQATYRTLRQSEAGYRMFVVDSHAATWEQMVRQEIDALLTLETDGISGAVVRLEGGEATLPAVRQVLARQIPLVFVDRFPPDLNCDFVGVDNAGSAQEIVEYLVSLGHRRIACLAPIDTPSTVAERLQGYERALHGAGITPDAALIWRIPPVKFDDAAMLREAIGQAPAYFASQPDPPTAVFVINDFLAQLFVWAIEMLGGSVPGTISVAGFDDLERYSARPAFLTTIQQPFEKIGERAAELLLRRLREPAGERTSFQHVLLPTKLIVRSSCGPAQETLGLPTLCL